MYLLPDGAYRRTEFFTAQQVIRWPGGRVHTPAVVYRDMMLQVMMDYASLPDPAHMPLNDIVFFYDGRRASLRDATRAK